MSSQLTGGAGTEVNLRAGNYVDLVPGFRADGSTGSTFLGYLGPCDSGMPPYAPQTTGNTAYSPGVISYQKDISGSLGTLEITGAGSMQRQVIARISEAGNGRIFLTGIDGSFIKDVTTLSGAPGTFTYDIDTSGLPSGMYYVYLVVNDKVTHLQEMEVK
jgi:hypothetical protein